MTQETSKEDLFREVVGEEHSTTSWHELWRPGERSRQRFRAGRSKREPIRGGDAARPSIAIARRATSGVRRRGEGI